MVNPEWIDNVLQDLGFDVQQPNGLREAQERFNTDISGRISDVSVNVEFKLDDRFAVIVSFDESVARAAVESAIDGGSVDIFNILKEKGGDNRVILAPLENNFAPDEQGYLRIPTPMNRDTSAIAAVIYTISAAVRVLLSGYSEGLGE